MGSLWARETPVLSECRVTAIRQRWLQEPGVSGAGWPYNGLQREDTVSSLRRAEGRSGGRARLWLE